MQWLHLAVWNPYIPAAKPRRTRTKEVLGGARAQDWGGGDTNRQQSKPPLQRDSPRAPRMGCAPQKAPDETRLGEIPAWVRTTCPNMHGQHLCTGFLRSQRKINHTRAHCVPERTLLNGKTKIREKKYSRTKGNRPHASDGVTRSSLNNISCFLLQSSGRVKKEQIKTKWRHATVVKPECSAH